MTVTDTEQTETVSGGELVYRALDPSLLRFSDGSDSGPPVVEGRMMPYGEWTEINSSIEGHFLERFAERALAKTLDERGTRIRMLFEHGVDAGLGRQAIAELDEVYDRPDGAYFRASLLEGLPPLLVAGLRRGLYGSSVRFHPVKAERVRYPKRSEQNPEGLEERTILEGHIRELSLTAFPAYEGATAHVRSLTDEITARQVFDPERLIEVIRTNSEPPHSGREESDPEVSEDPEPAAPELVPQRSRSTQSSRRYLKPQEAEPSWRIKRGR